VARVVAFLLTAIVSWLGLLHPAQAAAVAVDSTVTTYPYDHHHVMTASSSAVPERGPPGVAYDFTALRQAVDIASRGPSARPQLATTLTNTTYDHTGQLARGIGGAGTTRTANAGRVVELRVAPGVRVAAKSGDGLIDASKVRFTQDSAGSTFSDGRSVLDLADDMARTGKAPEGLPQIRLFEQDGKLYSLDNRRLFAGQYAGVKLPYRMATPAEIAARNQTQVFDGTSIMIRFPGGRGNWAWWQQ